MADPHLFGTAQPYNMFAGPQLQKDGDALHIHCPEMGDTGAYADTYWKERESCCSGFVSFLFLSAEYERQAETKSLRPLMWLGDLDAAASSGVCWLETPLVCNRLDAPPAREVQACTYVEMDYHDSLGAQAPRLFAAGQSFTVGTSK